MRAITAVLFFILGAYAHSAFSQKLATGYGHSCSIKNEKLFCWGWNHHGQLGLGHNKSVGKAELVKDLPGKVQSVSALRTHTCALTSKGVYCWGSNTFGWLGVGDRASRNVPTKVLGIPRGAKVTQISAGHGHTCALVDEGVMCWGWNRFCQLGTKSCQSTIVNAEDYTLKAEWVLELGANSQVSQIASSVAHTCALVKDGQKCWGKDIYGRLGSGSREITFWKKPKWSKGMRPGAKVSEISAAEHMGCAIKEEELFCYGRSVLVGRGRNPSNPHLPSPVPNLDEDQGIHQLVSQNDNTCILNHKNEVICFGFNYHAQLADPSFETTLKPTKINGLPNLSNWREVSIGQGHVCAQDSKEDVWCWGWREFCQLGDGLCDGNHGVAQVKPVKVKGLEL